MRKFYFLLAILFLFFFNTKVYAADSEDYAAFQQGFYEVYNVYIGNENVSTVVNRWEIEEKYLYSGMNGSYYYFVLTSDSQRLNNDTFQVFNGDLMYVRSANQISSNTDYGYFQTSAGSFVCTNGHFWDTFYEFMNPVDFDNIYYNPIIPTPNFSIKNYLHLNDYSIDYTMLVSDQSLSIDDHPLYLMSMVYFYVPGTVRVGYDSFTPYDFKKGGPFYISDYSDLELVNYQSYDLDNRFHSDYQSFYEYWAENRNFAGSNELSAGLLLQRTTQYVDDAKKGIPYMGNGLEVWMRYFYVDDGTVYAGDWKKWNSYRYRDYERVVAEEENAPSKGISQTINDNDPNTEGDTYNPVGVQTGNVSQTVNVNTNVPNYPDYPTISSFNKDNALVQVLDATSYMADPQNGFFGQFGGFLSAIFGFIPDSVWFIIGTGFSVSIFVMFLKIL